MRVIAPGDAARAPVDAQQALQAARQAGVPIETALPERVHADFALDALFGIGGSRELSGLWADAVSRLNAGHAPVSPCNPVGTSAASTGACPAFSRETASAHNPDSSRLPPMPNSASRA